MRVARQESFSEFTVDTGADEIDSVAHDVKDGDTVLFATTVADLPDGLDSPSDGDITAAADDLVTFTRHPYFNTDRVRFETDSADLPAGLTTVDVYFVIDRTVNTFKVSLTEGGTAVDITDAGTGTHNVRKVVTVAHYAINVTTDAFQVTHATPDRTISKAVSVAATTEILTALNHGFVNDDRVSFTCSGVGCTIHAGLLATITYFVVNASQNTFQVSLSSGGAAVDITASGAGATLANSGLPIDILDAGTGTHVYASGAALNAQSTPEVRRYLLTYVAEVGGDSPVLMESAPSLPSIELVTVRAGQRILLTDMPTGPGTGNYNITRKRIYRVNTSDTVANFQFVADVDIAQTEFVDGLDSTDLGEVLAEVNYDMPPHDLTGVKPMSNGMLIGFRKGTNEIVYAEPFKPHAWPVDYRRLTHSDIVGIGVYGQFVLEPFSFGIITTENFPYTVRGVHPSAMVMDQVELPYPCVSKRSIVDMGKYGGVLYASSDGIVMSGGTGINLVTRMQDGSSWSITPTQWRAKRPETISAIRWDQYYMAFFDDGTVTEGFLYDPMTGDFIFLDEHSSALYLNPETGVVHIFGNSNIQTWNDGAVISATWKDKMQYATTMAALTAARIQAATYGSLRLVVDADGVEQVSQLITSDDVVRIDTGDLANLFELELQTTDVVRSVELAADIEELLGE